MKQKFSIIMCILLICTIILSACGEPMPPPLSKPLPTPPPEGERASGLFSENYREFNIKYYIPKGMKEDEKIPMLVMLHGAYQTAEEFQELTNMTKYAETNKFMVLYIEQKKEYNPSLSFSYYDPSNQVRGTSEGRLIQLLLERMIGKLDVDTNETYIAGFGEGGSMAINLAICYPDLFSGVASVGSIMFASATSFTDAANVLQNGGTSPTKQGALAYERMPEEHRKKLKVLVFHGEKDFSVNIRNAQQIIISMANLNDLVDDGKDNNSISDSANKKETLTVENGYSYTVESYQDSTKRELMKKYTVSAIGHIWSGPDASGSYADNKGVDMSKEIAGFFFPG